MKIYSHVPTKSAEICRALQDALRLPQLKLSNTQSRIFKSRWADYFLRNPTVK